MATLTECIDAFRARMAARRPDHPTRVVRVAMLPTRTWHQGERQLFATAYANVPPVHRAGSEVERCRRLAETGERLGLERVGAVIDSTESVS